MKSTILLKSETREKLKHIAYKGQSYDELIDELITYKIAGAAKRGK
jgi:hypothetical protein